MEEADALGDRIAIMAQGRVRCLGSPLHLKSKHGGQYVLNITTPEEKVKESRQYIEELLPNAHLLAATSGNLKYGVPMDQLPSLVQFLQKMEALKAAQNQLKISTPSTPRIEQQPPLPPASQPSCTISDWGVSQTTLEEVFIRFGKLK